MRARFVPAGALLVALMSGACGADSNSDTTDNTTADLLAQPVGDGMSTPVAADQSLIDDGPRVPVSDLGFDRGDTTALVKVVELSDFGCGFCRQFHDETFPTLREEYIGTGMVEWKFVPYITGMFANSLAVTEAGECVMEQDAAAYDVIATRLWTNQRDWKDSSAPEPLVRGWVSELGIDMDEFDSCLDEDRRISRIASATTLARQVGVRGTPTFVVIGYPALQGALPLDFFQQILTTVHSDAVRQQAAGAEEGDTGN